MRVLILPSWYPTRDKPVNGIFIREQAGALHARHEVRVLYLNILTRGQKGKLRRTLTRDRGFIEEIWDVPNRRFIWQFVYLFTMAKALRALRRDFQPDVVHCHVAVPAGWAAALLKPLLHAPIVLTEHSSEFGTWLRRPGLRWMARVGMRGAGLVVAVSEGQRRMIKKAFPRVRRTRVISNMVDTNRFTFSPMPDTEGGFRLLFVGLLDTDQKGAHVLLDALALLREREFSNLHVRLVGDGVLRRSYEQQAQRLGVDSMVSFLGRLPNTEVARLLRDSHALVMPSLHESQGVVALEALASGRPVVATRCGGPEYVVDSSNGLIVEPGQAKPLADAMLDILFNLDLYDPGAIARAAVNQYSYEAITEALTEAYGSVMRNA